MKIVYRIYYRVHSVSEGAQVNPAVSIAMALTRHISFLRGIMFVISQCGGGIAGAALLYGVTVPQRQGSLPAAAAQLPAHLSPWERLGLELILTFVVVFTYFVSMDSHRRWLGGTSMAIGSAYLAASIVSMPFLNPARALGLAFVLNKWENHWVYWFGPIIGGLAAGLIYEFIFNPRRHFKRSKDSIDGDSSSIHSDEDTYDELDKPRSTYNTLRPVQPGADVYRPVGNSSSPSGGNQSYCAANMVQASLYAAPPCKLDRVESLYGGTKSLYCKSPPLTRANLNRSQSVYSKTTGPPMLHRNDNGVPRPGPLIPAQSLYPMRLNSNGSANSAVAAAANQNQQNQQRLGAEAIYGTRPANGGDRVYRKLPGRPESVYGQRQEPSDGVYQYQQPPAPRGAANYAPVPKPVPAYLPMQPQQQRQEDVGIPAQAPPPYIRNEHHESPNPQQQSSQPQQQQQQQQPQQQKQQQQQQQQQHQQQQHQQQQLQQQQSQHQHPHQFRESPQQQFRESPQQQFRESPQQQYRETPPQQQQYRDSANPQYRESPNPQYIHRQEQQARDSPSQQY
ncbi:neurogenic protein big brain [Halyomorpha halys]|uniref:neurogenic protein big brain n=1 Tax=Halyomorpha halys TaxID=286706 RepID=UPI0034D2737D